MGKYCCFLHPSHDYGDKSLDDPCPVCRRPYGFPLTQPPAEVRQYRVVEAKARGFYSATYRCVYGSLEQPYILKVSPVELYSFFQKDFAAECKTHSDVAQGTEHIVKIRDYFVELVDFGDIRIRCNVAVLDNIEGPVLREFLLEQVSARSVAQVAIDLFRIWGEFCNKLSYHNDLHEDNIVVEQLAKDARRAEAIDPLIRAMAIDLGSVASGSKSDNLRLGDRHWLCKHLQSLVQRLRQERRTIDDADDLDVRLAEQLERITGFLLPRVALSRPPVPEQLMSMVREALTATQRPWAKPLQLERFSDSYNAGALDSWYVPFLLVDPRNQWLKMITSAGPLLVTGMRGCGKTMLLRGVDFHARATPEETEQIPHVMDRLRKDGFVGLFVSCMNLLVNPGSTETPAPLERLFCAYCIEAIRAARHLRELDDQMVVPDYHRIIADVIGAELEVGLDENDLATDHELERRLLRLSTSLKSPSPQPPHLKGSPADAFLALAQAVRRCSPIWATKRIFYLLDDASTRFLQEDVLNDLFSSLVFQNPVCAFKLTTEAQTLEMVLHSPGLVERARAGRDYDVFDLGAQVYEETRGGTGAGKLFIEEVLERRAKYYTAQLGATPRQVLDDCTLEDIARNIARLKATSGERRSVYFGLSALSAVCVGDIGDVISLYELMLERAVAHSLPLTPKLQSDCYLELSKKRLYDLDRRESRLKDFALTFADASHTLLVRSAREANDGKTARLRQYAGIYVRITAGDTRQQSQTIRELIDAGVFVFQKSTPRTKTRDADPFQQFKLIYRKLLGLHNYIGLSERDRFELSGAELEGWLGHPSSGTEILLRNLGGSDPTTEQAVVADELIGKDGAEAGRRETTELHARGKQKTLMTVPDVFGLSAKATHERPMTFVDRVQVADIPAADLSGLGIGLLVAGLGFEARTLASMKRLLAHVSPARALLVEYAESGLKDDILALVSEHVADVDVVRYEDVRLGNIKIPDDPTLIDVTGLAKPVLFHAVRDAMRVSRSVYVSHTQARTYYPQDQDIETVLQAEQDQDPSRILDALSTVLTGEKGPYSITRLLSSEIDESRRKLLIAFASAKHQRLLSLLDAREYDRVHVVVPTGKTPRNHIARLAVEMAIGVSREADTTACGSDDLHATLSLLLELYEEWYAYRQYNIELGLTGSKLQAVAAAAVSSVSRFAEAWYVCPQEFDKKRFTKGVGRTCYYKIMAD